MIDAWLRRGVICDDTTHAHYGLCFHQVYEGLPAAMLGENIPYLP